MFDSHYPFESEDDDIITLMKCLLTANSGDDDNSCEFLFGARVESSIYQLLIADVKVILKKIALHVRHVVDCRLDSLGGSSISVHWQNATQDLTPQISSCDLPKEE